jgi:hypothetical protein
MSPKKKPKRPNAPGQGRKLKLKKETIRDLDAKGKGIRGGGGIGALLAVLGDKQNYAGGTENTNCGQALCSAGCPLATLQCVK